jgi:hypothetical protein
MRQMARHARFYGLGSFYAIAVILLFGMRAFSQQLNQNCVATIANRSVQVGANGTPTALKTPQ